MNYSVNLQLFEGNRHSPSFIALNRSMGSEAIALKDYCIPVNPYFPTPEMFQSFHARLEKVLKYYPGSNESLSQRLGKIIGIEAKHIVLGNGSTELITWINQLFIKKSIATPIPTFSRWTDEPQAKGIELHPFPQLEEKNYQFEPEEFAAFVRQTGARAAVLCNPNNPTGFFMPTEKVVRLLDLLRDLDLVVIDESFADFSLEDEIPSVANEAAKRSNVIVLKSLGKNFGLHGIRIGYAVANPDIIKTFQRHLPFWNINGFAEMLIDDLPDFMEEYEESRRRVIADRMDLENGLRQIEGLTVFPSGANFVYIKIPDEISGVQLRNILLTEYGLLIRECGNKVGSSSQYFRIAARPHKDQELLLMSLKKILSR